MASNLTPNVSSIENACLRVESLKAHLPVSLGIETKRIGQRIRPYTVPTPQRSRRSEGGRVLEGLPWAGKLIDRSFTSTRESIELRRLHDHSSFAVHIGHIG